MISRTHNTLDGHPEVKHEKDLSTNKVTIEPHPLQLTRLVLKFRMTNGASHISLITQWL